MRFAIFLVRLTAIFLLSLLYLTIGAQDYFYERFHPFEQHIPSPEEYLGYEIGDRHTRHDLIVSYLEKLAEVSDRATITDYGKTHEGRRLVILTISSPTHQNNIPSLRDQHLAYTDPGSEIDPSLHNQLPIFVNLGYNVHGNEPSGSEAALLTAYTLVASNHPEIGAYRDNAIVFIDPTINPDGRDRHTQWVSTYQGTPLVSDPQDAEHNEYWPGGRTNHYWFDLNRDWLLGIHPESRGKLNWYHQWYPNVVTDFHEMGTQSTFFFEPMKTNGSLHPIMPKENYEDLNNLFGTYFSKALDSIGSLYFTKEVFDGTYPGYGSSYPDLQGGLGLLFEQASSRGHVQETPFGEITFPFSIRNQYLSSITTVKAAVENKTTLRSYQRGFFQSAISNAQSSGIKGYTFGDVYDQNRVKAFIDKLLLHQIKVYKHGKDQYVVPTAQPQYRMVQTMFETYDQYLDSVYYDASAWSVANFYNMKYEAVNSFTPGAQVRSTEDITTLPELDRSDYAYIVDWDDYQAPATLHYLQSSGLVVNVAFKPFTARLSTGDKAFNYGSLVISVSLQDKSPDEVYSIIKVARDQFEVPIYGTPTGYSVSGIDLGSRHISPISSPKAAMLIGDGVRSYEAGEVWHLLDTRVHMPISKIPMRNFNRVDLSKYNRLIIVSGRYQLTKDQKEKISDWVKSGNTLITIGTGTMWVIDQKLVKERLIKPKKDSTTEVSRMPYVHARENLGKESVGGAIFRVDIDHTHPMAFGYRDESIPIYKNNSVWLAPSKNAYATVAKYAEDPHIDGFITDENVEEFLKPAASLIVSNIGRGKVIMFADNPNFRGSWYGTDRLFLNGLFFGDKINIPN